MIQPLVLHYLKKWGLKGSLYFNCYLFLAMQEGRSPPQDNCVTQSPVERPAKYHLRRKNTEESEMFCPIFSPPKTSFLCFVMKEPIYPRFMFGLSPFQSCVYYLISRIYK